MRHLHRTVLAAALAFTGTMTVQAAEPEAPITLQDALSKGKVSLNVRVRYERVEQDNALDNADALTVRTRLGYKTAAYHGFTAYLEAENNTALIDDYAVPGGTGKQSPTTTSVVPDPEVTEVSQAWLGYQYEQTNLAVGRQNLVLDNARFVGNVGWRQNYQTFDAVSIQDTTLDKLTLTYAYLWHIKRIFADAPGAFADFDSDSHLIHASYAGLPLGTLTGYAYLLDFSNAAANSSQTYGLSLVGSAKVNQDIAIAYRLEYATQSDYGHSALGYTADYYVIEIGPKLGASSLSIGYEVLGSDNGIGFKTPLATGHAFNGWADLFLNTPGTGLTDLYLKASTTVKGVTLTGVYHKFQSDIGSTTYGDEIDLLAAYKVNKNLSLLAKASFYSADTFSVDTNKFWFEANYAL